MGFRNTDQWFYQKIRMRISQDWKYIPASLAALGEGGPWGKSGEQPLGQQRFHSHCIQKAWNEKALFHALTVL